MKLLNLIIYSTDIPEYEEMYKIQSAYLKKIGIEHYFLIFSKNMKQMFGIDSHVVSHNNIIYFKGAESLVPGVLLKTLYGLEFFYKDYDYIIRSNISEIINFDLLRDKLSKNNFDYGGSQYKTLEWIDFRAGVLDRTLWGHKFVQGNAVIFSNNFKKLIVQNKMRILHYNVVDDVAFGLLYDDLRIEHNLKDVITFEEKINNSKYEEDIIFYRNKHPDRKIDVENMKNICDEILLSLNK
jgi:hypothetical protein